MVTVFRAVISVVVNKAIENSDWILVNATYTPATSYAIRFRGVRYNGWGGDIAIDDIVVYQGQCSARTGRSRSHLEVLNRI